ncbi:hypothetical protein [Undibacterium terreum]|uniref:hypothetical protein n=1 Tax=Undibacterium terreum TaxID=1224302 RepID=UPI00166DF4D7|nr:hypothetical protein [Undibacterium terreum]
MLQVLLSMNSNNITRLKRGAIFGVASLLIGPFSRASDAQEPLRKVPEQVIQPLNEISGISYRDVYQQILSFEKYAGPKQHIQNNFLMIPHEANLSRQELNLSLIGDSIKLKLAVDEVGRILVPISSVAYKEDAKIVLNTNPSLYTFKFAISLTPQSAGVYRTEQLRNACAEAADYLQTVVQIARLKKHCVGVKFAFLKSNGRALVSFKSEKNKTTKLPMIAQEVFSETTSPLFSNAIFLFANFPEKGQINSYSTPAAIVPIVE